MKISNSNSKYLTSLSIKLECFNNLNWNIINFKSYTFSIKIIIHENQIPVHKK